MISSLAIICLLLATGVCGFLLYAGMALIKIASRPRPPKHEHKWKRVAEDTVFAYDGDQTPCAKLYTLQCEGCGDICSRKVAP